MHTQRDMYPYCMFYQNDNKILLQFARRFLRRFLSQFSALSTLQMSRQKKGTSQKSYVSSTPLYFSSHLSTFRVIDRENQRQKGDKSIEQGRIETEVQNQQREGRLEIGRYQNSFSFLSCLSYYIICLFIDYIDKPHIIWAY